MHKSSCKQTLITESDQTDLVWRNCFLSILHKMKLTQTMKYDQHVEKSKT